MRVIFIDGAELHLELVHLPESLCRVRKRKRIRKYGFLAQNSHVHSNMGCLSVYPFIILHTLRHEGYDRDCQQNVPLDLLHCRGAKRRGTCFRPVDFLQEGSGMKKETSATARNKKAVWSTRCANPQVATYTPGMNLPRYVITFRR